MTVEERSTLRGAYCEWKRLGPRSQGAARIIMMQTNLPCPAYFCRAITAVASSASKAPFLLVFCSLQDLYLHYHFLSPGALVTLLQKSPSPQLGLESQLPHVVETRRAQAPRRRRSQVCASARYYTQAGGTRSSLGNHLPHDMLCVAASLAAALSTSRMSSRQKWRLRLRREQGVGKAENGPVLQVVAEVFVVLQGAVGRLRG